MMAAERSGKAAIYTAILEAFAVGDALGMASEFMTREEILERLAGRGGLIEAFVEPGLSRNHPNLERARITDDTEQNIYLLKEYLASGSASPEATVRALLAWIEETGAAEKRYIGPSSLAALKAIEEGGDIHEAGLSGRTCGGLMRAPAATLAAIARGWDLAASVHASCLPTHNTSAALEAAMAYAYAMRAALAAPSGGAGEAALAGIVAAALEGGKTGLALAPYELCAASTGARLLHLRDLLPGFADAGALLDHLYGVLGTGLESADVGAAALGIFLYAQGDVWLAIRMGASVGGDTDTIAALAGALSAAYGRGHNIPLSLLAEVLEVNRLDLGGLALRLCEGCEP